MQVKNLELANTSMIGGSVMHMLQHSTLIKKKIKFSSYIYKEIQSRAVAKSYMRKGFQIYEEMRKYFP
jgi:hypothetical protein